MPALPASFVWRASIVICYCNLECSKGLLEQLIPFRLIVFYLKGRYNEQSCMIFETKINRICFCFPVYGYL